MKLDLRDFLFGKRPSVYRVVFLIVGERVRVLRIRRSQRDVLSVEEIQQARLDE